MEEYLGKSYVMVSEENFEAYLEYKGLNYFKRKIAVNVRPTQTLRRNESGTYTFTVHAALFHWEVEFTPGVEYEADSPGGEKVTGVITFEGNVMNHVQRDKGGVSTHKLVFGPEETLVTTTMEGMDTVVKRVYKLVE
ncbi:fatty acid-binding protein 2-like isoform X1 [Ostrinia furnacalis]|uniref:fatty acid-binding protein 2-like isoform X1 n=1 Tax=Ostrinia furnacalis TaxID=93504 RepID=UPI00103F2B8E|nr:fatty acid-binding protein 2-like isoform X1 [Ostrinia furnacalis]